MPTIPILPNTYEGPPQIDRSSIPADQMDSFLHIITLLAELGLYERHFLQAVFLYEYCQQAASEIPDFATLELSLWTTGGWQMMAGRDGAMTIYHFGCAIDGIQRSFKDCPELSRLVDHRKIQNARDIFEKAYFPGYIRIRHAVAHVADSSKTLEKKIFHAVKGLFNKRWFRSENPNGVTWLRGNMNDTVYAVTHKGEAFTYDLSRDSATKMRSVKERIYSAFAAATISKPVA